MKVKIHEISMMTRQICWKKDCVKSENCLFSVKGTGDEKPNVEIALKNKQIDFICSDYNTEEPED